MLIFYERGIHRMKTVKELSKFLAETGNFYIFGTGMVGRRLFRLIGGMNNFRGYIVSPGRKEVKSIDGVNIFTINEVSDKESYILMSVPESRHPEAYASLREAGFKNIIIEYNSACLSVEREDKELLDDDRNFVDHSIDVSLSSDLLQYRNFLVTEWKRYSHTFGGGRFYQSLPRLGILGMRPTDVRIETYGICDLIPSDSTILDIGCNCGFIDLELADKVKHIVGIEYNELLVQFAKATANKLRLSNTHFYCADYSQWQKVNKETFDLIFSFAVHGWLALPAQQYANQLFTMLNNGGHLIFESHEYSTDYHLFDAYIEALNQNGFITVKGDMIKDDGETERKYVILRK